MKKSGNNKRGRKAKIKENKIISIYGKNKYEETKLSKEEYLNLLGLNEEINMDINESESFNEPSEYFLGDSSNVIMKSSYTKIDFEDGKPCNEEYYQSHTMKQIDKKGHKITEKKEKYKNIKTGEEKISHQCLLDDKGTKIIKKINTKTGDKEEHNILKGIREKDFEEFNKNYYNYKEKLRKRNDAKNHNFLNNKKKESKNNFPQIDDGYHKIKKKQSPQKIKPKKI